VALPEEIKKQAARVLADDSHVHWTQEEVVWSLKRTFGGEGVQLAAGAFEARSIHD
jgi:hypothetical protein